MDNLSKYYLYWLATANKITRRSDKACELVHFAITQASMRPKFDALRESEQIKYYVNNIVLCEWYNRSSLFHRTYFAGTMFTELSDNLHVPDEVDSSARIANETADIDITRLPEFERDLVLLYFEENKSVRELSEEIGIPYKYTKFVVTNAIKKLKRHHVRRRNNAPREI